ncbi:MAG TPA: SDR family NAD(P)-dependent oxidoreductase [Conexibacter sp.]|jgi:short-subunit dehydrogenase|nr:SDR family NAD(P)-dependent oxidoreductase [Conexibacter sp.]
MARPPIDDHGPRRLTGRRALVTGASSGVGAAAAQLLAREGADVALLARREEGLRRVARRVEREGARAVIAPADVGDRHALEEAIETAVRELGGGLDVVVVAAAAAAYGRFAETPARDFDRCVDVSFGGAVDTIRCVLPRLERSQGRLVVVGSAVDAIELPLLSPYVAAKHALHGFLESLRAELRGAGSGVTIAEVRPGAVDTPFWQHVTHPAGLVPPQIPPLTTYTAATVARAVVACAIAPRRAVTVGGSTVLLELAARRARPLAERGLALVARIGRAAAQPGAGSRDALWEPSGDGTLDGRLHGRPSLLAALRLRGARPGGRVGD